MGGEQWAGGWDYRSLPANIRLGRDLYLERRECFASFRSQRDPGLVLGDRVEVYAWTAFNLEPTGFLEVGEDSVLVGAVFMCAGQIHIGRRTIVSYNVTIADCDFHPRDPALRRLDAEANAPYGDRSRRPPLEAAAVRIGDDVRIGAGVIILKGLTVGDRARIEAGSVVTMDVPAGAIAAGNPARIARPPSGGTAGGGPGGGR